VSRLFKFLRTKIADRRPPDFIVGGKEDPYLLRWWVIPRNRFFNIYLHRFLRSDDDRALHDHPWLFNCSILLKGEYLEHTPKGVARRVAGDWKFRWGRATHRVELLDWYPGSKRKAPCWTLFITGPIVREWGFHCPKGWVHWKDFTDSRDKGAIGRGCGE
jgi:hypothetical protein